MRTKIYNLIILDESGSMSRLVKQTVDGCNETINSIKSSQELHADTQKHYISIYAFQANKKMPSRYIVKNIPAEGAEHIGINDYCPWGGTPLLDAVGSTLAELKATLPATPEYLASVTIITDGMENASRTYTYARVKAMISELKERGWNFNFIGANIDSAVEACKLSIDNSLQFSADEEGTAAMWKTYKASRECYSASIACEDDDMTDEERIHQRKKSSSKFFF